MMSIRSIALAALATLFTASALAQESAKLPSHNGAEELHWVTQQATAPRVSFHTFESTAAKAVVSYHVYRPAAYEELGVERFPVLYWLHGTEGGVGHIRPLSQIFDAAIRDTRVPPMIVVFVNGLSKRLWTNSRDGRAPIETVFIEELIPHVDKTMRTIARREGRILEGFSMGGYGAARIGFRHHSLFGGISILAGGPLDLDFEGPRATGNPLRDQILKDVCDGEMACFKSTHPWAVATAQAGTLRTSGTVIRQAVGSLDFSLALNRRFHEHLKALEIPHQFHVVQGVGHHTPALLAGLASAEFYRAALADRAAPSLADQTPTADADKPRR
jgi:enterochelin esterase-like enzyme